jgi:hypothetical protein
MKYEYGVAHISAVTLEMGVSSVEGMTEDQVDEFIKEWEEDGGRKGAFVKVRRPIAEWEVVE